MPQASSEQCKQMAKWFGGSGISDSPPLDFLFARGWIETKGLLVKPTPGYTPSHYEWACVNFLCNEWDYGCEGDAGGW